MNSADLAYIRRLAHERIGLSFGPDKDYFVEARLLPLLRERGLASFGELVLAMREDASGALRAKVLEALVVTETHFYRDGLPFDLLRRHIIPDLIARRGERRALNLWCGAASSGQEPYSVAMLLREHFPELQVTFQATDVSEEMLDRARTGLYSRHEVNRGVPALLLTRYFEARGLDWQVKDAIRAAVEFRRLNLLEPLPPGPPVDLVLLRNVLIYFDVPTKKAVLERVRRAMRPDGYLLLGSAETTMYLDEAFEPVTFGSSTCYRLKEGA